MKAEEAKRTALSNRIGIADAQLKNIRESIAESVRCGQLYCTIDIAEGELLPGTLEALEADGYKVERETTKWSIARYYLTWE